MKHGVFINQRNSRCSIYEAGIMIKNLLNDPLSRYNIDYIETDVNCRELNNKFFKYDFYVINWHHVTLPIPLQIISRLVGKKFAIILEVTPETCFTYTPDWFDAYMVIDSTKVKEGKVYPFSRPLEVVSDLKPLLRIDKVVIGGFGFICPKGPALAYKRFSEVVENANKIGNCIVRLNFPTGTFTGVPIEWLIEYGNDLKRLANPSVEVVITHTYMSKPDLVRWCSENTINSFPYYRTLPGISAVTDQAISAGRPIVITDCVTFRHMHEYISYYPKQSYLELIESTPLGIKKMQTDWCPENFIYRFQEMLYEHGVI